MFMVPKVQSLSTAALLSVIRKKAKAKRREGQLNIKLSISIYIVFYLNTFLPAAERYAAKTCLEQQPFRR